MRQRPNQVSQFAGRPEARVLGRVALVLAIAPPLLAVIAATWVMAPQPGDVEPMAALGELPPIPNLAFGEIGQVIPDCSFSHPVENSHYRLRLRCERIPADTGSITLVYSEDFPSPCGH